MRDWREQRPQRRRVEGGWRQRRRPPRRIRKKYHMREFTEVGFQLSWETAPGFDDEWKLGGPADQLFDRFIDFIEANGISGGGGERGFFGMGDCPLAGCPHHGGWCRSGSATEEQREEMRKWFEAQPEIATFSVGPLQDAHYGPWEDWEDDS